MRPLYQIKAFLLIFVVFLLLFMTSCSVEDYYEEDVSTPLKPIQEGTLYDKSPIDGVHYKTETQEGVTQSGGKFYFREDEAITFSIGDPEDKASIILAQEVEPYTEMTTVNFVPETIKIENNKVTNLSILLQSLDSATNKDTIEITQAITDAILSQYKGQSMIIDFDQTPNDFLKDTQVNDIFTKINDPDIVNENITRKLPKEEEVVEVQKSLKTTVGQIVAKNIGEVIKDFITIKTNINKYPLAFYVKNAELVTIKQTTEIPSNSSNISTMYLPLNVQEFHHGFRHDVNFSEPGKYTYEIKATQYDHIIAEKIIEITYDPDLAKKDIDFQNHTLLFTCTPYDDPQETFVIDLDADTGINNNKGVILGVIDGIDIIAATNNKNYKIDKYENNDVEGYYLIDKKGYVYRSSDYKKIELSGNLLQYANIISEDGLGTIKVISRDNNVIKCIAGRLKIIIYEGFIKIVEPSGYIKIIDTGNLDLKINTDKLGNIINQNKEIIIADKTNNKETIKIMTEKADVIINDVTFGSQKKYFQIFTKAKVLRIIPENGIINTVIKGEIDVNLVDNKDLIIAAKNSDNTIYLETDKYDLKIQKDEIIGDTRNIVITDSSDCKYYTIVSNDLKTEIFVNKKISNEINYYSRDIVQDIIPPGGIFHSNINEEITPDLLDFTEKGTVKIIGENGDNILYIKNDKYNPKMKTYINTDGLKTITIYENYNTDSVKDDIILFTIKSQNINTYVLNTSVSQPIEITDTNDNIRIADFGMLRFFIDVDGNFKIEDKQSVNTNQEVLSLFHNSNDLFILKPEDVRTLYSNNTEEYNVKKYIVDKLKVIIEENFIEIIEPDSYTIIDTNNLKNLEVKTDYSGNIINEDNKIIIGDQNNDVLEIQTIKNEFFENEIILSEEKVQKTTTDGKIIEVFIKDSFKVYTKDKILMSIPENGIIETVIKGAIEYTIDNGNVIVTSKETLLASPDKKNSVYLETNKSNLIIEKDEYENEQRVITISESKKYTGTFRVITISESNGYTYFNIFTNPNKTYIFVNKNFINGTTCYSRDVVEKTVLSEGRFKTNITEEMKLELLDFNENNTVRFQNSNGDKIVIIKTLGYNPYPSMVYDMSNGGEINIYNDEDGIVLFTIKSQKKSEYILDSNPFNIIDKVNINVSQIVFDNKEYQREDSTQNILIAQNGDNYFVFETENTNENVNNEQKIISTNYIKRVEIDDQRTIKIYDENTYFLNQKDLFFDPLAFENQYVYPMFTPDDTKCFAGKRVIDFFSNSILYDNLPFEVDNRKVTPWFHDNNNKLTYGVIQKADNSTKSVELLKTINLSDYSVQSQTEIIIENLFMRAEWAHLSVAPNRTLAFLTTYSEYFGAIDIINIENNTTNIEYNKDDDTTTFKYDAQKNDALSDRIGKIEFSIDGSIAIIGSYGHPEYGGGGLYLLDANTGQRLSKYTWADYQIYGANQISIDKDDGFIYASARYEVQYEGKKTETSRSKRGIIVLKLKEDNTLEYIKNYYFHSANDSVQFIKQ